MSPYSNTIMYPRILFILCLLMSLHGMAQENNGKKNLPTPTKQQDTAKKAAVDTIKKVKPHSPRTAAIRSAILPGLGQAYNKKYWKIPIVYGALGTTTYIFFRNIKFYNDARFAYRVRVTQDVANYPNIDPQLQVLSNESLRYYRDQFRRDIDYSVLFFILFWGLNVIDAAVDGHLKNFDVSPDLSLQLKPGYNPNSRTNGITLALDIHKAKPKLKPVPAR
jgi:Family of unknown function (DUF5683)